MSKENKIIIYTFDEVREILNTSKPKLRKLLQSGELKGFKIGKNTWKIPDDKLREYIQSQCS